MELICNWCGETKPEDLFVKRVRSLPFSQSNVRCCRQCQCAYNKRRYAQPEIRAKQLRANSNWRKAHPDDMERHRKKLHEGRPDQQRARNRISYLLRRNLLVRRPCQVCGSMKQVEAHHDSYAEPHWETVRWLCKDHHEAWHQILDPIKAEIAAEPLVEAARLREDAIEIQRQITALRDQYREKQAKASAIELSTWNRVVEAAQPKFEEFMAA